MIPEFATSAMIGFVPLLFVVLGLVQYIKLLKNSQGEQLITGNWLLLCSLVIGSVFGVITRMLAERPPGGGDWYIQFVYWVVAIVYGLAIGLIASGLYDVLNQTNRIQPNNALNSILEAIENSDYKNP